MSDIPSYLIVDDYFEPRGAEAGGDPMSVQPCRAGATAVIGGRMPNGHFFGYVKECSLPTGWTEDGKELSGRSVYDLVSYGALVPCSDKSHEGSRGMVPEPKPNSVPDLVKILPLEKMSWAEIDALYPGRSKDS